MSETCRVLGIANPDLEADPDHQDPGHDHGIEGETVTGKIDRRGAKGERAHTVTIYDLDYIVFKTFSVMEAPPP
ncbi:hypothetical protein DAPPUDRAFT_235178 [Daphnia pulex]|uniref:Uncharacterized protein n=1 Tax=Daphnia pulex TaxID=6669 RepID=E9FYE6_DAPPU|nr:hypothetical protein DAPPUDRAFT_235178 [Daphnia pulex]|eukprot:EFX87783.1 hypothetical protein DAPPUDRAFT_235178 [Daphnia pulex]